MGSPIREKILVVDDAEAIRHLLEDFLTAEGFEVKTAQDGEEALGVYQRFQPDVVMTDIRMPKRDGFELVAELRRKDPKARVMYLSGSLRERSQSNQLKRELSEHPEYQVLAKPFRLDDILKSIETVLKHSPP
jgi:DNA-binding response OmpR family regulator